MAADKNQAWKKSPLTEAQESAAGKYFRGESVHGPDVVNNLAGMSTSVSFFSSTK